MRVNQNSIVQTDEQYHPPRRSISHYTWTTELITGHTTGISYTKCHQVLLLFLQTQNRLWPGKGNMVEWSNVVFCCSTKNHSFMARMVTRMTQNGAHWKHGEMDILTTLPQITRVSPCLQERICKTKWRLFFIDSLCCSLLEDPGCSREMCCYIAPWSS